MGTIRAKRWITHGPAARVLATLAEAFEQPRGDRMEGVLLLAESGMGKTSLLRKFGRDRAVPPVAEAGGAAASGGARPYARGAVRARLPGADPQGDRRARRAGAAPAPDGAARGDLPDAPRGRHAGAGGR
ncbi:MAG: TniB family NTP-binding protein [Acetobacteraceae bacterium]|nr:TniB family NTP-binding protein [Acetobacteraceae bacterium]